MNSKSRRRVLIAHPRLTASGGGNAVAAWTLQALRGGYDLSLATLEPPDHAALNRSWGTSLAPGDFEVRLAPARYRGLLRAMPTPGALLETCLVMRLARDLDRERRYDILISTHNEADFGRRGIAYIHYPWAYLPRPDVELRWFHHLPGLLRAYRRGCQLLSRGTTEGLRRNLSVANSAFVASRIRDVHGIDSLIVHPPVTGEFPDVPWERREAAMVAVGRISFHKRWEMAVAIADEVRRRGHDLRLTLIGHRDDPVCQRHLEKLAATRPWFRMCFDLSRGELTETVAAHRYGIHTMEYEHFGIGPAETVRAGCVLFTHNSGGPVEIVGGEQRLLFDGVGDAADKIERVLTSPGLEAELRTALRKRSGLFAADAFCDSMRAIVAELE